MVLTSSWYSPGPLGGRGSGSRSGGGPLDSAVLVLLSWGEGEQQVTAMVETDRVRGRVFVLCAFFGTISFDHHVCIVLLIILKVMIFRWQILVE